VAGSGVALIALQIIRLMLSVVPDVNGAIGDLKRIGRIRDVRRRDSYLKGLFPTTVSYIGFGGDITLYIIGSNRFGKPSGDDDAVKVVLPPRPGPFGLNPATA